MNIKKLIVDLNLKPTQIKVLGFLFLILTGAIFLNLPMATKTGESAGFLNALFTSTSAVCVTGLVVVNTLAYWSIFGKIIILLLIQLGGLGFMILVTILFVMFGKKFTTKHTLFLNQSYHTNTIDGMENLIKNIIKGTLIFESLGAIFLSFVFIPEYGFLDGIFKSIFHSVSALCNAGFDIIGNDSLVPYANNPIINIVIMLLIIIGGIGFTVWSDLDKFQKEKLKEKISYFNAKDYVTLHSKIVLSTTFYLLIFGFVLFFAFELNNPESLVGVSKRGQIFKMMFQSVTPRTAGFNTMNLNTLTDKSKYLTIFLMFVGGSPGSTAGGIKTVTFAVIIGAIIAKIKNNRYVKIHNKNIPKSIVKRSFLLLFMSMLVVTISTYLLLLTEKGHDFLPIFFESTSAFGTVGLSLGVTQTLSEIGKIIIIATMFLGRLGPITVLISFIKKENKRKQEIKEAFIAKYKDENVLIG